MASGGVWTSQWDISMVKANEYEKSEYSKNPIHIISKTFGFKTSRLIIKSLTINFCTLMGKVAE